MNEKNLNYNLLNKKKSKNFIKNLLNKSFRKILIILINNLFFLFNNLFMDLKSFINFSIKKISVFIKTFTFIIKRILKMNPINGD